MRIDGYDLDGVLSPRLMSRKRKLKEFWYSNAPLIMRPVGEYFIVSGRKIKYEYETNQWAKKNGLNPKGIFLMESERTQRNMIKHKIKKISELGIERFYEDDPKIAEGIRKSLPSVEVIDVNTTICSEEEVFTGLGI